MAKTLVALYKESHTAQQVIEALLDTGFSGDDINLLVKGMKRIEDGAGRMSAGDGASLGALVGALVGIGSALVPGIGPLIGSGPLAVAISAGIGAAAGALTGGISSGLIDLGLSEEEAEYYEDGLRGGGTVVSVTTNEDWLEWAYTIMNRYDPLKIEEREAKWYDSEWSGRSQRDSAETVELTTNFKLPTSKHPASIPTIKRVTRAQIYNN